MRSTLGLFPFCLLAQGAIAHFMFSHLIVNGTITEEWKYVRDLGNDPAYPNPVKDSQGQIQPQFAKYTPMYNIDSPDFTCGRDAISSAHKTEIADIVAGTEVGFHLSKDYIHNFGTRPAFIMHDGPGQVYLSAPPNDDLQTYRGDGNWFKVGYAGPTNDTVWKLQDENHMNFTIPTTTPPGKYLMRIELFMPSSSLNSSQYYVSCAHVNIIGAGGGTPREFAKFPGTYKITDPGIQLPDKNMDQGNQPFRKGLLKYLPPGPSLFTG